MNWFAKYPKNLMKRINSSEIISQKYWKFIQELNSFSEERLDSIALICGEEKYTYRQMFAEWERLAEIFSALNITGKSNSRIGLISSMSLDCINMIYAANMTGASISIVHPVDVKHADRFDAFVEKEGITDMILASDIISPDELRHILDSKKKLSLKNIIVYYFEPNSGEKRGAARVHKNPAYMALKNINGAKFLDDLKEKCKGTPVYYDSDESKEAAIVFHTSGTTSGVHKPVPLSDSAFNESAARILRDERFSCLKSMVTMMTMEPIAAYASCDMMHLPLAYGGTVVVQSTPIESPATIRTIIDNKVSILFTGIMWFDAMDRVPFKLDLSNLELIFLGGVYISPIAKKRYIEQLEKCGCYGDLYIGYGLTEIGGASILTEKGSFKDALGKPLPGVNIKILDEDDGKYYELSDGKRIGVLCLSSKSLSSGELCGNTLFELIDIDGEKYLNTYDLVEVDEDGDMKIIGRMNKFFVNNDGIRFDAGLIETAMSGQPGIDDCGLVPEYEKLIHDTLPVLYVKTRNNGPRAIHDIKEALVNVFVMDGKIVDTNLPSKIVIVDDLPYTHTGKVDVHQIQKEKITGVTLRVDPVRVKDRLVDVKLTEFAKNSRFKPGGFPDEITSKIDITDIGGFDGRGRNFGFMKLIENAKGPVNIGGELPEMKMPALSFKEGMHFDPDMILELFENGTIEPEMIGRMLARMLIKQEEKGSSNKRRNDKFRGC